MCGLVIPLFSTATGTTSPHLAGSIFTWEGMTSAKKLDLTAKQQLYDKTGYTETTRYDTDEQTDRSAHSAVHT